MKISLTDPLGNVRKYALPDAAAAPLLLGRAADCDIVLENDANVSRYHALLEWRANGWYLADNHSANGVLMNGTPVLAVPLRPGHELTLGSTVVRVEAVPPQAEEEQEVVLGYAEPLQEEAAVSEQEEEITPVAYTDPPAAPVAAVPPLAVQALPPRCPHRRLPAGSKPQPRALKNAGKRTHRAKAAPSPRAVRRAVAAAGGAKPPRTLRTVQEVEAPNGVPATALGLPYDFELQFFLAEPRHAVTGGSVLRFGLAAGADCCVFLVQHDSEGNASLILPCRADGQALLHAGKATALPPKGLLADDELVAGPPYGTDTVVAVACTAPDCPFGALLAATLQQPGADGRPGVAEREALEACRAAMGDAPAYWSCAVLQVQTFAE